MIFVMGPSSVSFESQCLQIKNTQPIVLAIASNMVEGLCLISSCHNTYDCGHFNSPCKMEQVLVKPQALSTVKPNNCLLCVSRLFNRFTVTSWAKRV